MKEHFNVFHLIKAVNITTFRFEDSKCNLEALHNAKIRFYTLQQVKNMDNAIHLELFQMHVAIVEQFGGEIARDLVILLLELELVGVEQNSASEEQTLEAMKLGKEKYLAMALIWEDERNIYNCLMDDLINQFTMGHNNYPVNIKSAYNLLRKLPCNGVIDRTNHLLKTW
jgi:hypothetical protein